MGSGATKNQNEIQSINGLFAKLTIYLNDLKTQLAAFTNAQFNSVDEMNQLEVKKSIDLLQKQINAELMSVRKAVKEMKNRSNINQYEQKLTDLNMQTQQLYDKVSLIIKDKIKPYN